MSKYYKKPGLIKKLIIAGLATAALIGGGIYAYKEIKQANEPGTVEPAKPDKKVTESQLNAYKSILEEKSQLKDVLRINDAKKVLFEYTKNSEQLTSYVVSDSYIQKFDISITNPVNTYEQMAEQLNNADIGFNGDSWNIVGKEMLYQQLYDSPPEGHFKDMKDAGYEYVGMYNLSSGMTGEDGRRYDILASLGYFFNSEELIYTLTTFACRDYRSISDFNTSEKMEYDFMQFSDVFADSFRVTVEYDKQLEANQSNEFSK